MHDFTYIKTSNTKGLVLNTQDFIRYHIKSITFGSVISILVSLSVVLVSLLFTPIIPILPIAASAVIFGTVSFAIASGIGALARYIKLKFNYKKVVPIKHSEIIGSDGKVDPSIVNQGNTNICGIASVATVFAATDPQKYANQVECLNQNGHILEADGLALLTTQYSHKGKNKYRDFLLAMRYTSNWLGYSASLSSSFFELFLGITRPKRIAAYLIDWGCRDVIDTTKIVNTKHKEIGWFKRLIFGGINFHSHHSFKDTREHLKYAQERISCQHNPGVMLISPGLAEYILFMKDDITYSQNGMQNGILDYKVDHYVYVDHFKILEDGKYLQVGIITWGKKAVRTVPIEEFIRGFRGIIVGAYPGAKKPRTMVEKIPLVNDSEKLDEGSKKDFIDALLTENKQFCKTVIEKAFPKTSVCPASYLECHQNNGNNHSGIWRSQFTHSHNVTVNVNVNANAKAIASDINKNTFT